MALDIDERHLLRLGHGEDHWKLKKTSVGMYLYVKVVGRHSSDNKLQLLQNGQFIREHIGEVYLEPCRRSVMELFVEIVKY